MSSVAPLDAVSSGSAVGTLSGADGIADGKATRPIAEGSLREHLTRCLSILLHGVLGFALRLRNYLDVVHLGDARRPKFLQHGFVRYHLRVHVSRCREIRVDLHLREVVVVESALVCIRRLVQSCDLVGHGELQASELRAILVGAVLQFLEVIATDSPGSWLFFEVALHDVRLALLHFLMRILQACHDLAGAKHQGVLALGLVVREVEEALDRIWILFLSSPLLRLVPKLEIQRSGCLDVAANLLQRLLPYGRSRIVILVASELHLIVS